MSYGYNVQSLLYSSQALQLEKDESAKRVKYIDMLKETRDVITRDCPDLIRDVFKSPEKRTEMKSHIARHVHQQRVIVEDKAVSELSKLVDQLYDDMFGFGIITQYLFDPNVKAINGNRWDDIEVTTFDGYKKLAGKFANPQQAQDIIKRMALLGGVTVDSAMPTADSQITEGIRIHVKVPPIIDDSAGVQFSIRKQREKLFSKEEYVQLNTASNDEIDFILMCLRYGVSIGFAGGVGSGKTADITYYASQLCDTRRIYVIEDTREIQLERIGENGIYESRVMHTKTRFSNGQQMNVDARRLVRDALRCDPNIIIPSEMRGAEALDVMEAGRTGHTIITSFHANDAEDAYARISSMAMMANAGYSDEMLIKFAYRAFPIMVYKMVLPDEKDKEREVIRYIEIAEAQKRPHGQFEVVPIFRYIPPDDENKQVGIHVQVNPISEQLAYYLRLKKAPLSLLRRFTKDGVV
ncbi:MAG TPA: ATPase, T2SS/T4P/T4SS family [Clostridia bacterium]|nr:ATPase, T2SS/T4P/T4SS family [Clostridia bacterium]